jgi:inorganic pyrophosphatase
VPDQLQIEIAHFFAIYKNLENKRVEVEGWHSREDAIAEIEASRRRWREH